MENFIIGSWKQMSWWSNKLKIENVCGKNYIIIKSKAFLLLTWSKTNNLNDWFQTISNLCKTKCSRDFLFACMVDDSFTCGKVRFLVITLFQDLPCLLSFLYCCQFRGLLPKRCRARQMRLSLSPQKIGDDCLFEKRLCIDFLETFLMHWRYKTWQMMLNELRSLVFLTLFLSHTLTRTTRKMGKSLP